MSSGDNNRQLEANDALDNYFDNACTTFVLRTH